ncbi:MAG: universal stress protein [Chitinophagaceae bacterium]|jgi:nucleotide-binding universal stress UspA family protein|nr:universal stress protein [Chitinophagaceae bacterium]
MKTVIVPVDFSDVSFNAAVYAARLITGHHGVTLLLYHHYSKDSEMQSAEQSLTGVKQQLNDKYLVNIETLAHHGKDFIEDLEKAVRHRSADLVIMGITGRSPLGQMLIGSNTLKFAEQRACPVLIIPEKATFRELKNVMLASDFKNVYHSTPSSPIKTFLQTFRPKLHVVNVDPEHYIAISESYTKEKVDFEKMFSDFNPEFYFMRLFDIEEALNMFAKEKNIDLIIAVHRQHSFFDRLFNRSGTTKKLSYQSEVPVLVVHE